MLTNFIYAKSKAMFKERLHEVPNDAIVFIEDTKEIWNHGHYFAGETIDPSIVSDLQTAVAQMQSNKLDSSTAESTYAKKTEIPTPDWNASTYKEGHIKNRTHHMQDYMCHYFKGSPIKISKPSDVGYVLLTYDTDLPEKFIRIEIKANESKTEEFLDSMGMPLIFTWDAGNSTINVQSFGGAIETYGMRAYYSSSAKGYDEYFVALDEGFIPEEVARKSELKTINGKSILGEGDIEIKGGSSTFVTDFTVNDLYELVYRGAHPVQANIVALQRALENKERIVVPYGTEEYKGYSILQGYYEDLVYFTVADENGSTYVVEVGYDAGEIDRDNVTHVSPKENKINIADLQQKNVQTDAKLTELSKKTDDLCSATFNPFTRLGEAFAEGIAVPRFVANANADSTDYLPVPPRIVGRLYLSNSNPNYKISFLTTDKKFISNYAAPSTGVQDVNFAPPSNAAYMVITTYKAYTDQGYLMRQLYPVFATQEAIKEDVAALKADTENLGTMQKTTYDMAANTRLSKGLPCNTGKVVLRFDMIEGSNSISINISRYTNNAYNAERLITGAELGKSYVLDIPEGDDGIWIFLEAGASAYKLVCTIENKLYERVSSVEGKVEELQANQSWKGRTIVCFGDSLTEFKDIDNDKAYADYIHDITGAEVYNIGIGGSQYRQRMTPVANPTTSSEAYAALDMINVVKACCEQEFSKQIAATNFLTAANLDRNDEIIARMQTIDWSKVDIVTLYGGGNDWNNASESWGEPSKDNNDINTTYGAINEIVRILLTAYPHLRIYWFSPSVSWQTDSTGQRTDATWSDNLKKNGTTKGEFADIIMQVVKAHHLPICDMYNTLGWNQLNFSQFFTDTDGSHPRKGEGTLQTAKKIIAFINANRTF